MLYDNRIKITKNQEKKEKSIYSNKRIVIERSINHRLWVYGNWEQILSNILEYLFKETPVFCSKTDENNLEKTMSD